MTLSSSRRQFLRAAAGVSFAAAGSGAQRFSAPFALSLAGIAGLASQSSTASPGTGGGGRADGAGEAARAAAAGADYRALVCLYLSGGNDSHNWVVPIDTGGYAEYAQARSVLALPRSRLSAITTASSQGSGRQFAMATDLQPLRALYEQGQVAVVANVGTLLRPTTLAEYRAGLGLPLKLFSHNDQASTWQSMSPEGARSGWGGRMGDLFAAGNAQPIFTAVSATGNAVFLSGQAISQYQVSTEGPIGITGLQMTSGHIASALQRVLADAGSSPFQAEYSRVVQRSIEAERVLKGALAGVSVPAVPPTPLTLGDGATTTLDQDSLARQLKIVAQLIAANQGLGMRRQVFMVSLGGFDAHAHHQRDEPSQMARVAHSVSYFLSTMASLGLSEQVTLFTASDFGRTLATNGDGSDHGWGSHHFVAGGAVKGGDIYGDFPLTALGTPTDLGAGRLLPTTSVTQYAATLATWMGVTPTDLPTVLPGLENFSTPTLPFL